MYHQSEEPEFPHWWDVLDESTRSVRDRVEFGDDGADGDAEALDVPVGFEADDTFEPTDETDDGVILSREDPESRTRVSESSSTAYLAGRSRGYEREVIESVWNFAEIIPGNDPDLWRKDELGNWIRRLDYGRRESEFGWEIFDPGIGRHSQGVYAMRPMQWGAFLVQHEVLG